MNVYKYSNIEDESFENLKNGELYFNNPSKFHDTNDSNLKIFENDLTTFVDKSIDYINSILRATLQNLKPPNGLNKFLKSKKTRLNLKDSINEFKNNFIGITCFSESNSTPRMWNDYASENKGFCICFESNLDKAFFKGLTKIEYVETLPTINLTSDNFEDGLRKFYTTKDKGKYGFEEERRIVEMRQGLIKYDKSCVEEIILGDMITEADKRTIINIIKEFYSDDVFITQK